MPSKKRQNNTAQFFSNTGAFLSYLLGEKALRFSTVKRKVKALKSLMCMCLIWLMWMVSPRLMIHFAEFEKFERLY